MRSQVCRVSGSEGPLIEEAVAVEQLAPALLVSRCGPANSHLGSKSLRHKRPSVQRLCLLVRQFRHFTSRLRMSGLAVSGFRLGHADAGDGRKHDQGTGIQFQGLADRAGWWLVWEVALAAFGVLRRKELSGPVGTGESLTAKKYPVQRLRSPVLGLGTLTGPNSVSRETFDQEKHARCTVSGRWPASRGVPGPAKRSVAHRPRSTSDVRARVSGVPIGHRRLITLSAQEIACDTGVCG
jgi:hypothetical protein